MRALVGLMLGNAMIEMFWRKIYPNLFRFLRSPIFRKTINLTFYCCVLSVVLNREEEVSTCQKSDTPKMTCYHDPKYLSHQKDPPVI